MREALRSVGITTPGRAALYLAGTVVSTVIGGALLSAVVHLQLWALVLLVLAGILAVGGLIAIRAEQRPRPASYAAVKSLVEARIAEGVRLAESLTPQTTGDEAVAVHGLVVDWEEGARRDLARFSARWVAEFGDDTPGAVAPNDAWNLSGYLYAKLHRLAALLSDDYDPEVAGVVPAARVEHAADCLHKSMRLVVNFEEPLPGGGKRAVWQCSHCGARWPE